MQEQPSKTYPEICTKNAPKIAKIGLVDKLTSRSFFAEI